MRRRVAAAMAATMLVTATVVGCEAQPSSEVTIRIHYSVFAPATVRVPAGEPVTFTLVNDDPIDHEWIVGDDALHEAHRTGTHPAHDQLPTEVTVPALETRTTVVTFDEPGSYTFICHLPAHEAYGMVGVIVAG
jgi:plastocyanin